MRDMEIAISRHIPRFLHNEKNGYALAAAIEACMRHVANAAQVGLDELLDVSRMSEWRLDEMAWEWHVTWYDYGADVETKRRTIAGMRDVFVAAGTPTAVQAVIEQYFGDGSVEEWPEYGADPYHFRVFTSNPKASNEAARQLAVIVEMVKNTRSIYDGAIIERALALTLRSTHHTMLARIIEFAEGGIAT